MKNKQILFEQVGLTWKEAKVYQVLLSLGECPISEILRKTKDHPQVIYRAIDGLISRGLIVVSFKNHKKYVQAESPKKLQEIAERKFNEAKSIVPELIALQKVSADETIIRVHKGLDEVKTARAKVYDELPAGGTYYIIGGSGDRFYQIMGKELMKKIEKKREKKKIWKKTVTYRSQQSTMEKNDPSIKYVERRYLPLNFPAPSSTGIFGNKVHLFIFSKEPIAITIESPEIAQSYRQHFETLWAIAKK